jgi:hypothetical protein
MKKGTVYILKVKSIEYNNRYKIGSTQNFHNRVSGYKTHNPTDELIIKWTHECIKYKAFEKWSKEEFKQYNHHGEWFIFDDELLEEIIIKMNDKKSEFNMKYKVDILDYHNTYCCDQCGDIFEENISDNLLEKHRKLEHKLVYCLNKELYDENKKTIELKSFGTEKGNFFPNKHELKDKFINIYNTVDGISLMINLIYFNKSRPENHTIVLFDEEKRLYKIFDGTEWHIRTEKWVLISILVKLKHHFYTFQRNYGAQFLQIVNRDTMNDTYIYSLWNNKEGDFPFDLMKKVIYEGCLSNRALSDNIYYIDYNPNKKVCIADELD